VTSRAGDLVKAFSVLLDYGHGRSLVGHFGFDTHYVNRATFISADQMVDVERFFTIPGNFENEIQLRRGLVNETHHCGKSDPFENFFRLVLEGRMDFDEAKHNLMANATGITCLKEYLQ